MHHDHLSLAIFFQLGASQQKSYATLHALEEERDAAVLLLLVNTDDLVVVIAGEIARGFARLLDLGWQQQTDTSEICNSEEQRGYLVESHNEICLCKHNK